MTEVNQAELERALKDQINKLKRIQYKNLTSHELDERNRKRRKYQKNKRNQHLLNKDYLCKECNTPYSGPAELERHKTSIGHRRRSVLTNSASFFHTNMR